jgi:hypothetical protein
LSEEPQPSFILTRKGMDRIYHRPDIAPEDVLQALGEPGEILKSSRKSITRRLGPVVVKSSRGEFVGVVRMLAGRARYRRAWQAAQHLEQHGIAIPRTLAYVEHGLLGLVTANHLVSEYLEGYRNAEQYLLRLIQTGMGKLAVSAYLAALADAVNELNATGACHHDLSGKNIFTLDGSNFLFIDLDDVSIGEEYTEEARLKNLIQLYDSFCDVISDAVLVPFISRMLPQGEDPRVWMPRVRKGQQTRRRVHEDKNPGAPRPLIPNQGKDAGAGKASHS